MANPYQVNFLSYSLRRFTGKRPRFRFMRRSFIERMIRNLYLEMPEESTEVPEDEDRLLELAGEANIIRLVNEMLTQALERKASDIHIEPFGNQVAIRFRIDGLLQDYLHVPAQEFPALASRVKLVGNLNIAEKRLPQDGRTNFKFSHYDIDIRISTIPVMNGESIVMRLLHKDSMRF